MANRVRWRRDLAVLVVLVCVLAAMSNQTDAATGRSRASSADVSPPIQADARDVTIVAQTQKKAKGGKKKKRCKALRKHCQYSTEPGFREQLCTPENIKFMQENCLKNSK